jgi:hypothetical protein
LGVDQLKVWEVIKQYHLFDKTGPKKIVKEVRVKIHPFKFPSGTVELNLGHKNYLRGRQFSPKKLVQDWGLKGTGPIALLDDIDFRFRIIIPISWNGKVVTFQARDITNRSSLRYIACPKPREIITHKHIIYGNQARWEQTRTGIVCEGVTDVWRLGPDACATFGIEFTMEQVLVIGKTFDRIFILFDNEKVAQRQAKKLATKLRMLGKEVYLETVQDKDPGSMLQEDADYLVKQLIGKK